jgi:hypothetical protein
VYDSDSRRWRALLLFALVLAALRFAHLGTWSLWHDEALALSDAVDGLGMANPLGYLIYRLSFAASAVRPSELLLRLPAAICGAVGILLTFLAFRGFVPARRAAAAAVLVGVSHWHLYWSQNARFYTLSMDLALVGGALVLGGLLRGRARRVAGGLLLLVLATSAHPSAAFLLAGVLIGPWIARAFGLGPRDPAPGAWRVLLGASALLVLAGLPWAHEVWGTWVEKKAANPAHFLSTTGFYVSPYLGAGALVGALLILRRREAFDSLALATLVAALGAALAASTRARMSAQYVFWALPWIALVASAPIGAERRRGHVAVPRWMGTAYLALLVLPGLANVALYFKESYGDRPRWREAYAYVWEHSQPGDLILGMEAPVGEYYLDRDPGRMDVRRWREVAYLDQFRATLAASWSRYPRRTWIVMNREQLLDWPPARREEFREVLRQEFRAIESFDVHVVGRDLDVLVYLRE